jgi:putative nucleotidyltransferase with HDIG domain
MIVDEAIAKIEDIPTIPTILGEILRITSSENSSAKDLSQVIYSDQSMAAKILKMANSSFYGFVQQIKSIDRAIVILGFDEVRSIAMAMSVFDSIYLRKDGVYYSRLRSWNHSLLCGLGTRVLSGLFMKSKNLESELFAGGLIHDIGKVLMDRHFPESFARVLELVEKTSMTMESAEQEVFGFDHALLAGRLLRKWKFPDQLIDMVQYHHHPDAAGANQSLIALIFLADLMCHQLGYSTYTCEPKTGIRKSSRIKVIKLIRDDGLLLTPKKLIASFRKMREHTSEIDRLSSIFSSP